MIELALSGVRNIRDLGGTPTFVGRSIRPDCLIRSAHLAEATDDDLTALKRERRLTTVIDLRTAQEIVEKPDHAEGLERLHFSIIEALMAGVTHEEEQERREETLPDMADLYRAMMLDACGIKNFAAALRAIFAHDYTSGSILWHCTEGKDRCGMTTALVLEALGVDRAVILEDYLLTNRVNRPKAEALYREALVEKGEAYAKSVYHAFLAEERYIRAAWDAMGKDYLRGALGIQEEEIEAFRNKVLTDR